MKGRVVSGVGGAMMNEVDGISSVANGVLWPGVNDTRLYLLHDVYNVMTHFLQGSNAQVQHITQPAGISSSAKQLNIQPNSPHKQIHISQPPRRHVLR